MTDSALSQPLYGASFGQAVARFFTKYATFSGRASRSEFWWSLLFLFIVLSVIAPICAVIVGTTGERAASTGDFYPTEPGIAAIVITGLIVLALIIPRIAVSVRRLHDANYSGWMFLLVLIPQVGGLLVLIFNILPSNPEGARFDRSTAMPSVAVADAPTA